MDETLMVDAWWDKRDRLGRLFQKRDVETDKNEIQFYIK